MTKGLKTKGTRKGVDKLILDRYKKSDLIVLNNRRRTNSLFYEISCSYQEKPIFNIKEDRDVEIDGVIYLSMKRLYLECNDPTEVIFVDKYLYDWSQWERIAGSKLTGSYVDSWREELSMRIRSNAIQIQIELAKSGNQNAAKWLATKGWEDKPKRATRKAEKAATEREKEDVKLDDFMAKDAARLGLTIQ